VEPVKSRGRDVGAEWLGNHEGRENGSVVLEDWSGRSGRGVRRIRGSQCCGRVLPPAKSVPKEA